MKTYYGRRVEIYKWDKNYNNIVATGTEGRLLKIDVGSDNIIIEDSDGRIVKLNYKLVRLIRRDENEI